MLVAAAMLTVCGIEMQRCHFVLVAVKKHHRSQVWIDHSNGQSPYLGIFAAGTALTVDLSIGTDIDAAVRGYL
jgi:hypothetical protein